MAWMGTFPLLVKLSVRKREREKKKFSFLRSSFSAFGLLVSLRREKVTKNRVKDFTLKFFSDFDINIVH